MVRLNCRILALGCHDLRFSCLESLLQGTERIIRCCGGIDVEDVDKRSGESGGSPVRLHDSGVLKENRWIQIASAKEDGREGCPGTHVIELECDAQWKLWRGSERYARLRVWHRP